MTHRSLSALAPAVATAVATLAWALTSQAGQVDVFVNYAGSGCNVCGAMDYAFVGSELWNDGTTTFADPVPAGAIPVQMLARAQGVCDGDASVVLDGTLVGTTSFVGSACACDTCADGTIAASAVYEAGWPGYVPGAVQTLQLQGVAGSVYDGVNLTIVYRLCGDGTVDPGESCDTGGDSATCNADCTPAACGDGHVNAAAGELCDVMGENAACDDDCTLAECGDGHVNAATGEACDDHNTSDGDGCSSLCQIESGSTATSGGPGAGGGSTGGEGPGATGGGGEGAAGAGGRSGTGPTASGIAVVGAGAGGRDRGEDDDDDDGGSSSDGGSSAEAVSGASSDAGCGCVVPRRSSAPLGGVASFAAALVATLGRRRARRSAATRPLR